ncbi:copine family protein 1-like [Dreissena polymorpha]|uniref:VWFA domain-containing protein n=1 Tax=Dreissena polymorpha TaxID=45954 RepID=A0A9D4BY02_DREPO|nr:copine family protein 1-like [Dreissena polymorpha]XP_052250611.1 copine family protein 1-like [Dreissena polymorpha]XP_052250612.1 copine family protein 1-like [Dreissena polymorpha]KAH3713075.1 hypothetical protein DPMN_072842 [Dreissena polymorpha]
MYNLVIPEDSSNVGSDSDDHDLTSKIQAGPAMAAHPDAFSTLEDVTKAIKEAGVTNCGLIFGIDYTLSNRLRGEKTFGGRSLHDLEGPGFNPYQEVICILGETIESLDDDGIIPCYGFGDKVVKGNCVFPLKKVGECDGFSEVLDVYNAVTPQIKLGGPTNFAPLIYEAIEIVKRTRQFHVLVIVADGQVTSEAETIASIVDASGYPLSIIVVGVGDGPWDVMHDFDDKLPARLFDNFHFVEFHAVKSSARNQQAAVALAALMEIPKQYKDIKSLGLLEKLQV